MAPTLMCGERRITRLAGLCDGITKPFPQLHFRAGVCRFFGKQGPLPAGDLPWHLLFKHYDPLYAKKWLKRVHSLAKLNFEGEEGLDRSEEVDDTDFARV